MSDNIFLIKGDDEILLSEELRRLISSLPTEVDGSRWVEHLDEEDYLVADPPSVATIIGAVQTPPMFSQYRIVVARHLARFSTVAAVSPLVSYIEDPLPSTILILIWDKGSKYTGRSTVPKSLTETINAADGQIIETALPSAAKSRQRWFNEQLSKHSLAFDSRAKSILFEHLGEDLNRLGALLNTLEGSLGPDARISEEELRPFIGEAGGVPPWELTDAIASGDMAGAIEALGRMQRAGERHALQIMATLHRHVGGLMALDGSSLRTRDEAAKVLGMAPYPAEKLLKLSRSMGSERIRQQVLLTAQADLDLRGASEWPDELVLEVLVARLARLSRK